MKEETRIWQNLKIFKDFFTDAYHHFREEQTMNTKQEIFSPTANAYIGITYVGADFEKLDMAASSS